MAALEQSDNFYLELSKKNIRFDPVSTVTNVFFDDSNRQVSIEIAIDESDRVIKVLHKVKVEEEHNFDIYSATTTLANRERKSVSLVTLLFYGDSFWYKMIEPNQPRNFNNFSCIQ